MTIMIKRFWSGPVRGWEADLASSGSGIQMSVSGSSAHISAGNVEIFAKKKKQSEGDDVRIGASENEGWLLFRYIAAAVSVLVFFIF